MKSTNYVISGELLEELSDCLRHHVGSSCCDSADEWEDNLIKQIEVVINEQG